MVSEGGVILAVIPVDEWDEDEEPTGSLLEMELEKSPRETLRDMRSYYSILWSTMWWPTVFVYKKIALGVGLFLAVAGPASFWFLQGREDVPIADLIWAAVIPLVVVASIAFLWNAAAASTRHSRMQNRLIGALMHSHFEQRDELETIKERGNRRDVLGYLLAEGALLRQRMLNALREVTDDDDALVKYQAWEQATTEYLTDEYDALEAAMFMDSSGLPQPSEPEGVGPSYVFDAAKDLELRLIRLRELAIRDSESG